MSEPMLKVAGLNAFYGRAHILFDVGLEVGRGEVVALMGRNGAGKSTTLKAVMGAPGPLDPLTRELIYIAVSITNGCSYCIHSHTAAARAKGMTDAQYSDFTAVVAMASQTNALVTALQLPVDAAFLIES